MNHIYRIIFNRASGVFQVVSELAKGKVKSAKTSVKLTALCMALVSGVVLADEPVHAPTPTPTMPTETTKPSTNTPIHSNELHYFNVSSKGGKYNFDKFHSGAVAWDSIAIGKNAGNSYYAIGSIALGAYSSVSSNVLDFGYDSTIFKGSLIANDLFEKKELDIFNDRKEKLSKLASAIEPLKTELEGKRKELAATSSAESDKREKLKQYIANKEDEIQKKADEWLKLVKEIAQLPSKLEDKTDQWSEDARTKKKYFKTSAWIPTLGSLSIGDTGNENKEGITRQITGVAAGKHDTDAVNVAQLKRASVHYFSTSGGLADSGNNYGNDAAIGIDSIAIGVNATIDLASDKTKQQQQIAIGRDARSGAHIATAIGSSAYAKAELSNAFGYGAVASGVQSNSFGALSRSLGYSSFAIGTLANAYGSNSIAFGVQASSKGYGGIAIGSVSKIENDSPNSLVLGMGAYVGKKRFPTPQNVKYRDEERDTTVANGNVGETGSPRTIANNYDIAHPVPEERQKGAIAIGFHAKGYGYQTIAIGGTAEASGSNSLAVGVAAESRGLDSAAIGTSAVAYREKSTALGYFSSARAEKSLALGANTRINEGVNGGVALGSDSFNYRDLATIGYDISEQATKFEINRNQVKTMFLGEAGKKYQELQDEIAPLKEAYEKERQNYADLAELRNILYDLPKKQEEVDGLKSNMEQLKTAANPNQAEIDRATKSYETAKNELEKMQKKLTALQTKTTIQEKDHDKAKPLIEAKLTETEKKADKAESDLNKKQQEQNKLVSTWKGTAGSVSVGNEKTGITRQITSVAAGTADTDAVNLAQLKSAGLHFAVNSDNQGFAGTDKTHNFYKHVGETLSILGESGVGYKADLYSSRNLITYHDNDGIRIAMKTNPVFDRLTLVNKDDPSKSLELYAKTGDDGKAHLIQAEKAPETDNAVKEKPQTPNNGTDGNHNTAGQGGANGQNGQDGDSSSTGNAGSAGSQGSNGSEGHNGSTGQGGANGQNGQDGGTGSTGNAGSAGSQGSNGTAGHNGSTGQDGANGQNGANTDHGINSSNGSNGLSANETDLTRAAIKGLNQATGEINRQIRKTTRESRAGIAAAMAMGQIYPVQGKRFTVGAAAGTYRGQSAVAVGVRYTPKSNMIISLSGSADTNNGVGAATGVSFGF